MSKSYQKLGAALDRDNWAWLLDAAPDVAEALQHEVVAGGDPAEIGRYVSRQIGDHRGALVSRVVSAARHLQTIVLA